MRALSGAATGQGSDLAGQILYLLEQARCVRGLGDGCCGGERSDFCDLVGQLLGGVKVALGLASQYDRDVGR